LKVKNHVYKDNLKVIGYTSENRAISAFILEGGDKVNCSLPYEQYQQALKYIKNTDEFIKAKDGSVGKRIASGIRVDIRCLSSTATTLRFPVIMKTTMEGLDGLPKM
jgi:uncharacterized radical SAM superfamily protein